MTNLEGATEKEMEALEFLKDRLGDYIKEELDSYQRHDKNLLRWLRARDMNVDKAEKMLKASMIWRRENDVDKILNWKRPEMFDTHFKFYAPGTDKDDCVISIVPFGRWDFRAAVESGHRQDIIKYSNQILEQGFAFMRKESNEKRILNQFIIIFDWEGFALNQILSRETVETMMECLRVFEANYPESLKNAYVINAPAIFELVYNLLKPFVTAHTLSKVRIFGSNPEQWRAALLKNIEPFNLPSQYGGTNTACKYYDFRDGVERIPRADDLPKNTFKTVSISAGEKIYVDFIVTVPGTKLTWNFKTEHYDIGFHFYQEDEELFSCMRVDSHLDLQKGVYVCDKMGKYKICFDNSFSKFRSKTIHYAVLDELPIPTREKYEGSGGIMEKIDQLG